MRQHYLRLDGEREITPAELEAVAGYVAEGGQVLVLLDNPLLEGVSTPSLVEDLDRYGIVRDLFDPQDGARLR